MGNCLERAFCQYRSLFTEANQWNTRYVEPEETHARKLGEVSSNWDGRAWKTGIQLLYYAKNCYVIWPLIFIQLDFSFGYKNKVTGDDEFGVPLSLFSQADLVRCRSLLASVYCTCIAIIKKKISFFLLILLSCYSDNRCKIFFFSQLNNLQGSEDGHKETITKYVYVYI